MTRQEDSMPDMYAAIPAPLRAGLRFDPKTAAYYACLYELERRLQILAQEYGVQEYPAHGQSAGKEKDGDGDYIELTDYLLLEDV